MADRRTSWRRGALLAVAAPLGVAVAVAANQVLDDGVWDWRWGLAAVALSAAALLVGERLTAVPAVPESGERLTDAPETGSPATGPQGRPKPAATAERSEAPAPPARAYGGDHVDFSGGVFNGPVTGKSVTGPASAADPQGGSDARG
ncbi:hypothetical protein Ppa06_03600 [Planomonospora parontospora subsp. parontospora]|uniref:Uncharacterized protein n=2 Tax=Planomonospora parontospora TaxID=58119 RepID=A0AA37BBV6_9ACTN|nr:hypothetical protein [Planomonospora parontospora]GGK47110.1 hypothetical protein GCM10010126_03610 [Planomonospora parontospora]GII06562.1 hypothetical protein Ppa06_03600 [Planomonospora parontospora subsp. parontospora]